MDEFSSYITVKPIARKSDMGGAFIRYHVWMERKFGCAIKCLDSDGGGDYKALEGYLNDKGIE